MATGLDEIQDAALLADVRKGGAARHAAFERLFSALSSQVLALCAHVTGNGTDAEDALQETFLAVHAALPKFRGHSRITTWVHRIAIRAAIRIRARRRLDVDVSTIDPPCPKPDPVLAGELAERLSSAMDRLAAGHRIVISLFAVDGLKHAEIARILGVPEGTVWSRLHAARKRLAQELGITGHRTVTT